MTIKLTKEMASKAANAFHKTPEGKVYRKLHTTAYPGMEYLVIRATPKSEALVVYKVSSNGDIKRLKKMPQKLQGLINEQEKDLDKKNKLIDNLLKDSSEEKKCSLKRIYNGMSVSEINLAVKTKDMWKTSKDGKSCSISFDDFLKATKEN